MFNIIKNYLLGKYLLHLKAQNGFSIYFLLIFMFYYFDWMICFYPLIKTTIEIVWTINGQTFHVVAP